MINKDLATANKK